MSGIEPAVLNRLCAMFGLPGRSQAAMVMCAHVIESERLGLQICALRADLDLVTVWRHAAAAAEVSVSPPLTVVDVLNGWVQMAMFGESLPFDDPGVAPS